MSGEVVRLLCKAMREESAVADVDVAIVLNDGPARAAAQHERSDEDWSELPPKMRDAADALAKKARNGDLVLFLGAGVSQLEPARGVAIAALDDAALLELAESGRADRKNRATLGTGASKGPLATAKGPVMNNSGIRPPLHRRSLRCSSLKYTGYSPSSRLALAAHQRP